MYILFDIGGTKMRLAASRDGKTFEEPQRVPTPLDFAEAMRQFRHIAQELANGERVEAMAGGVAGPFDRERTKLVNAPNLPDWVQKPLKDELSSIADGAPVLLENDTAVVGLGEATFGAAKGYGMVAYVSVGTGVGGARIVDGAIDKSVFGFEIGHQYISVEKTHAGSVMCSCGASGHLEGYISGTGFQRRYGKKPVEIADSAIWEEAAKVVAYGLNNVIVHWSPDVVVLGGSMILGERAISIDTVATYLKHICAIFPELPKIKKAQLGDDGGLHGALVLLKYSVIR